MTKIYKNIIDYISKNIFAEPESWILWAPIMFGLGIGGYFSLSEEPSWSVSLFSVLLSVIFYMAAKRNLFLHIIAIGFLLSSCGFTAAKWRSYRVFAPAINQEMTADVSGRVLRVESRLQGYRITLEDLEIENINIKDMPEKIRITARYVRNIPKAGDRIELRARLMPPSDPVMPNGFDYRRYLYFKEIGAIGFAVSDIEIISHSSENYIDNWFDDLRQKITVNIETHIEDRQISAVAIALLTGQRGLITEDVQDAIRGAGLAHLLAISGLHIGLVAGIIFYFTRFFMAAIPYLALNYPIKKIAAILAVSVGLFYMLLVAAPIPTQRAMFMTGLVFLAIILNRVALTMRLVALAAMIILIVRPDAMLGVSFQMSFAAVAALISTYQTYKGHFTTSRKYDGVIRRAIVYIQSLSLTSIIAMFATAPFALYHFHRIALYGLLGNILAVPIMGLWVMPWGLLAIMLMPFQLENIALVPMGLGIDYILNISSFVNGLDGSIISISQMNDLYFGLICSGGIWLCFWQRPWRKLGLLFIIAGFSLGFLFPLKQPDVLVNQEASLWAIRLTSQDYVFSDREADDFTAENWLRILGLDPESENIISSPENGQIIANVEANYTTSLSCKNNFCQYENDGVIISFLDNIENLKNLGMSCDRANIIIAAFPISQKICPDSHIIDSNNLSQNGAESIFINHRKAASSPNFVIYNIRETRGNRPWARGFD